MRRDAYLADLKFWGRYLAATDASPWGIGGVLLDGDRVVAFFADAVTADDVRYLGVTVGDPAAQAVLEGLAVLVAARLFAPLAQWGGGRVAAIGVHSASKAALGAAACSPFLF